MTTMKRYEPTTVNYPARWAMLWGVAAIIAGSAGCTAPDPINAWKKSLATYIVHEGDSDPNILRESGDLRSRRALRPARVVFGKTKIPGPGSPCSGASRDVNGVLAGLAKVGDYRWFVFVVGVQGRRPGRTADLEDVRLVGFTIDGPYFIWRVSPPNPDNLADYRALATVSATDERAGPTSRGIFPRSTDVFDLAVSDGIATVTEQDTQVSWSLGLVDPVIEPREPRSRSTVCAR